MTVVNNELHETHNKINSHQVLCCGLGCIDCVTLLLIECFMNVACTSRYQEESIRASGIASLLGWSVSHAI